MPINILNKKIILSTVSDWKPGHFDILMYLFEIARPSYKSHYKSLFITISFLTYSNGVSLKESKIL